MFYSKIGKMALGSRLRMLGELLTEDAKSIYELYGVELKPKWFPVFYVLSQKSVSSITAIAGEIGHSHPSVSKTVREMSKAGITIEKKDKKDGRKNLIALTQKGLAITDKITDQYQDVNQAVELILSQTQHNLWKAMEEFEFLLEQKSLFRRVREEKKKRAVKNVTIIPYETKYRNAFKNLNEEWIRTYFKIEAADSKTLDHPKENILDKGGHILVALYKQEPIGVCALIKNNTLEYDFELAKMAVSPKSQGLGIGMLLGEAILTKAKDMGAKSVYLESNTILKPAIKLYQKLGFKKVSGHPTPYERSNIQMLLKF